MSNVGQDVCSYTGKIRYSSSKDAHNALVGVRSRHKQNNARPQETPYYCDKCAGWHLGRRWTEVGGDRLAKVGGYRKKQRRQRGHKFAGEGQRRKQ